MKHFNVAEWSEYAEGRITVEKQRELEAHLYSCEACLQLYMDCVAQLDTQPVEGVPEPDYMEDKWIDEIMSRIEEQKQPFQSLSLSPPRKLALYRRPVFHYSLAAAITIILMATGIFQGITGGMDQLPLATKQMQDTSYTDKWMNKTVAMLDTIQLKAKLIEKGGSNHD
jgi:anti-sigma factor RsiW